MQVGQRMAVLVKRTWPCYSIDADTHRWVLTTPRLGYSDSEADAAILQVARGKDLVGALIVAEYVGPSNTTQESYPMWRIVDEEEGDS